MEIGYVSCVRRKWRCVVQRRRLFSYRNLYTARSKYKQEKRKKRRKKKLRKTGNSIPLSMLFELVCVYWCSSTIIVHDFFFSFVFRLIRFSLICLSCFHVYPSSYMLSFKMPQTLLWLWFGSTHLIFTSQLSVERFAWASARAHLTFAIHPRFVCLSVPFFHFFLVWAELILGCSF